MYQSPLNSTARHGSHNTVDILTRNKCRYYDHIPCRPPIKHDVARQLHVMQCVCPQEDTHVVDAAREHGHGATAAALIIRSTTSCTCAGSQRLGTQ